MCFQPFTVQLSLLAVWVWQAGKWLDYYYTCVIVHSDHQTCTKSLWNYHIALNFQGSKFLWIAIFEDFVDANLLHAHTHTACHVSKFSLKYFRERVKICEIREIKDPRKFSAIRYCHYYEHGITTLQSSNQTWSVTAFMTFPSLCITYLAYCQWIHKSIPACSWPDTGQSHIWSLWWLR